MKRTNYLMLALLFYSAASTCSAEYLQSSDRDHPTHLQANELTGDLDASGDEYFYSFVARPGELTITVDVKSNGGTTPVNYELLSEKASEALICCEYAQADTDGASGRKVSKIRFSKRRAVILHISKPKYGNGTYRVRLSGAGAPYDEKDIPQG